MGARHSGPRRRRNVEVRREIACGERSRAAVVVSVSHRIAQCESHPRPLGKETSAKWTSSLSYPTERRSSSERRSCSSSSSFFHWFRGRRRRESCRSVRAMWHGVGVIAGLLLLALIVWQAVRLANINLEVGVTPSMITAALAVLLIVFTIIRFLASRTDRHAVDRTFWAWLGLILAIVIVVGAWMNMQAAGEGLADVRDRVSSMTAGSGVRLHAGSRRHPAQASRPRRRRRRGGRRRRRRSRRRRRATEARLTRFAGRLFPDGGGARLHSTHGRDRHAARQERASPRCSRAASSWTSSTPSRRGSPRRRARAR